MHNMYEEFFNYIATRIIGYFEQECDNLHDGDRFCFKLDNGDLVEQVNAALYDITRKKDIQGTFSYQEKYHTFTVKLANKEIIIAAQVNGMTDDFSAKLDPSLIGCLFWSSTVAFEIVLELLYNSALSVYSVFDTSSILYGPNI